MTLVFVTPTMASTPPPEKAITYPPSGGTFTEAFIKSNYGAARHSVTVEDYYMSVARARDFARKMDSSAKDSLLWLASSWIPVAGPYMSIMGTISSINASKIASDVRSYTDYNKRVHVTAYIDEFYGITNYGVKYWDGKASSVKPWSAPNPDYQTILARYYR